MAPAARHRTARTVDSPVGPLLLLADDVGGTGVYFPSERHAPTLAGDLPAGSPILDALEGQLQEYFAGRRHQFAVPTHPAGTDFQGCVWDAVIRIPYASTSTYAEIAAAVGRPAATRAVGAANAINPLSIVVPCHRVIGSTGQLTGYGGGLAAKRWLLSHEAAHASGSGEIGQDGPTQVHRQRES